MEYKIKKVFYNSLSFEYRLTIKKVKNINLKINEDGSIDVSANAFVPEEVIQSFIISKMNWILSKRELLTRKSKYKKIDIENSTFLYLGKAYPFKVIEAEYTKVCFNRFDNVFEIKVHANQNVTSVIDHYLIMQLEQICFPMAKRIYLTFQDYRIDFPQIRYRKLKSAWGSCVPSRNKVTLNTNLIHCPIAFIEYVILHEFAHLIQPNHSKSFYQLIENRMPDYRDRINLIK